MKISDVTVEFALNYVHEDPGDVEAFAAMTPILPAAKDYIINYTGLTAEEIDEHEDLTYAYLIMIEDLYDNRSAYVSNDKVSRTLDTILSLHSRNNVG